MDCPSQGHLSSILPSCGNVGFEADFQVRLTGFLSSVLLSFSGDYFYIGFSAGDFSFCCCYILWLLLPLFPLH